MTGVAPDPYALVPELGPAFGRLTAAPVPSEPGASWVRLDDLRLDLVTRLFEIAGAAREFAVAEDRAAAVTSLDRAAWLREWERTVGQATARVVQAVEVELAAAADEARLPRRRRAALPLSESDRRAITARLTSASLPFIQSLDTLERLVPAASASGPRGAAAVPEWREALLGVARRLESAWLALERATDAERDLWRAEIERVRAWRRPRWPLWLITALVLAGATYLGLVLGGYVPLPEMLRPLAEWWWRHLP